MNISKDIEYRPGQKLDVYLPESKGFKTIVYFHGGGLVEGSKDECNSVAMMKEFADDGFGAVNANYRLYPNAKFPDYLEDAASAIKYVFENVKSWGGNGDVYVSGQSAGAYMIMMLCLNPEYLSKVGIDPLQIKGWISDSGQMSDHFHVQEVEEHIDPWLQRITMHAPLYYVNQKTKSNPIFLITYEDDMLCREDQNRMLLHSIRHYNGQIDITHKVLKGGHCAGSSFKDPDGKYPYVKESVEWLKNH